MKDREKVFNYLEEAGVLFLATVNHDKPKNRPIGFKMLVDNQIYFLVGENKDVYEQMMKNTNVEFVGLIGDKFIRYYGRVVFDVDENHFLLNKAFELMPVLKEMYGYDSENRAVIFHVDKATAELYNMMGVEETYNFLS